MDLPPSKLSGAATRLWNESAGQFHKKTDLKIDLGLQPKIQASSSGETAENNKASTSISSGYVFGSRVSERVTKTESDNKEDAINTNSITKPMDVSSIFKRIAEKSAASTSTTNLWKTSSVTTFSNGSNSLMGNTAKDFLKESANELARKSSQLGPDSDAEQQEIKTGEEDERNLLHVSCKFYQYNTESKVWQERGMGSLKINQNIDARDEIRLVGRQSGNQRVLINSKIFPEMILEELSEKRLKISAQTNDSELPQLFLVQASPASITNLQNMLQKYIDAYSMVKATQHQLHIRKRRLEKPIEEDGEEEEDEGVAERTKKFIPEEEEKEEEAEVDDPSQPKQQQTSEEQRKQTETQADAAAADGKETEDEEKHK